MFRNRVLPCLAAALILAAPTTPALAQGANGGAPPEGLPDQVPDQVPVADVVAISIEIDKEPLNGLLVSFYPPGSTSPVQKFTNGKGIVRFRKIGYGTARILLNFANGPQVFDLEINAASVSTSLKF